MPILEVQNVAVHFGGVRALRDVSLSVEEGEIRGLIGPNGSGKTTLINAISGFVPMANGSIRLLGKKVDGWGPHKRAWAGLARTFQSATTFVELDVLENVEVGFHKWDPHSFLKACVPGVHERLRAENRKEARGYLATVGLRDKESIVASELPYGQQRMLDLARALGGRPKLLLLDEPAAGLNLAEIDRLDGIVRELRSQGITILLIEHHMKFVMGLCDRVTVLDFGSKIAEGEPEEVQSDPLVIEAYLGTRKT